MDGITFDGCVPFDERNQLPRASGVYFVYGDDKCLYVGQSRNMKRRWSAHEKIERLASSANLVIFWINVSPEQLYQFELKWIKELDPPLNMRAPISRSYHQVEPTTHIRISLKSHAKLQKLAGRWNTSLPEALRYVIDLAEAGEIPKKLTP